MPENTNQAEASTNTDLAFSPSDFTADETSANTTTDEGSKETDTSTEAGDAKASEKFKIKYNGKEEEYSIDELTTLAQKGRNYDHVVQERDSIKNSEQMKSLERMAKEAGLKDVNDLVKTLETNLANARIEDKQRQYEAEGMTPEHARRMAELEAKTEKTTEAQAVAPEVKEVEDVANQFKELFDAFPETKEWGKVENFPEEMQKFMSEGSTPLVAYTKHLKNLADESKRVEEQNKKAQSRDTGSFKGQTKEEKEDSFLSGLFGK